MHTADVLSLFEKISGARQSAAIPALPTQSGRAPGPRSPLFGTCALLVGVFPYDSGGGDAPICRYARGADYHEVLTRRLSAAAQALSEACPGRRFLPGCDRSAVNEVRAAALAGLGRIGDNGLFISHRFGSFVFLGTLATDLPLDAPLHEPEGCLHCGACRRACPTGVLEGGDKQRQCLSAITQKKGELSPEETALLRRTGALWGCDACQSVCPLNHRAERDPLPEFTHDLCTCLPPSLLQADVACWQRALQGRSFAWRGPEVLRRNLRILFTKDGDNAILNGEIEDRRNQNR